MAIAAAVLVRSVQNAVNIQKNDGARCLARCTCVIRDWIVIASFTHVPWNLEGSRLFPLRNSVQLALTASKADGSDETYLPSFKCYGVENQ